MTAQSFFRSVRQERHRGTETVACVAGGFITTAKIITLSTGEREYALAHDRISPAKQRAMSAMQPSDEDNYRRVYNEVHAHFRKSIGF